MTNQQQFGKELNWEDEIQKESEFIILPAGDYDFTVEKFERARHNGSEKLPPCPKAVIYLRIHSKEHGDVSIIHNLFLHEKTEGMLSAFFIGIGQKKKGQPFKMNWNAVSGSRGRCKLKISKWKAQDGNEIEKNEVVKFYEPETQSTGFQQPQHPNFQQMSKEFNQPPAQPQQQPQQQGQQQTSQWQPGAF